jgi:hypothetical protein
MADKSKAPDDFITTPTGERALKNKVHRWVRELINTKPPTGS